MTNEELQAKLRRLPPDAIITRHRSRSSNGDLPAEVTEAHLLNLPYLDADGDDESGVIVVLE